jgi:hypothetical protein
MACLESGVCLPAAALALSGGACILPTLAVPAQLPPSLWLIQLLAVTPLICCAFFSPAAAACAVSARHLAEWDDDEGKFVGVEDDTLLFDDDGEFCQGDDVYNPLTPGEAAEHSAEEALRLRRRASIDAAAAAADAAAEQQAGVEGGEAQSGKGAPVAARVLSPPLPAVPPAGASGLKEE